MAEKIITALIETEMKESYLDYSMSVIVGRALPDVRDGLKPVHRRILYAMHEEGLHHDKKFTKCAGVVGEVLKKFHPHGDISVYDALVRLAQPWALRYPLILGQGNFGSQDGDPPAAYRYTESKLHKIAGEMLQDIDKETVDFIPNFDGTTQEPTVLPSKLPNLLVNGSSGIAVGMATNIPPHNIHEVVQACVALIDHPQLDVLELMSYVKGPDFPTGGLILGTSGIKQAYKTGKGRVLIRSKHSFEEGKIIITEIPYQLNKSLLIEEIADLVKEKTVSGISDLRDESDRKGMRIVLELKKDANPDVVLNQLYKHSQLQTTFGINIVALVHGEPKQLSLKECLEQYLFHRKDVVLRRTRFELRKAEERAHIVQGLNIALERLDEVIPFLRKSKDAEEAKKGLIVHFNLTIIQAQAILDMKLQRLTSLEREKLIQEYASLMEQIRDYNDILGSEPHVWRIIKNELLDVEQNYSDERKTILIDSDGETVEDESLIPEETFVVTLTHLGYVKRLPLDTYKAQHRGGKGIIAAEAKDGDFIQHLFVTNSHASVLFFTDQGRVHWLKAYELPDASRYARGNAIVNLLKLEQGEKITAMIPVNEFIEGNYLVMATKQGLVKKTSIIEYSRPRQGGVFGITLKENDKLVGVQLTTGDQQLLLATKDGRAVRFRESDIRIVGRLGQGVRGINVKDSEVIGMEICNAPYLLTVTNLGYGKRSEVNDYRLINRGGSGVINIKSTDKNGFVAGILVVNEYDEILSVTKQGVLIRFKVSTVSVLGRNTQGVRVMRIEEADEVVTVARVFGEEDLEGKKPDFVPDENGDTIGADGDLIEENNNGLEHMEEKPAEAIEPQAEEKPDEPTQEIKEQPALDAPEPPTQENKKDFTLGRFE
ncbi:DNA gyrase subunit A [Candidatus Woesearchaeota archaeon]|nr:DNA gyrase subunit A [Candidatus Woesearchaeota archaeon]